MGPKHKPGMTKKKIKKTLQRFEKKLMDKETKAVEKIRKQEKRKVKAAMTAARHTEKSALKRMKKVTTAAKDTIAKAKKSHVEKVTKAAKDTVAKATKSHVRMFGTVKPKQTTGRGRTIAKATVQPKLPPKADIPKPPKQVESTEWLAHSDSAGVFAEDGHTRLATLVTPLDNQA